MDTDKLRWMQYIQESLSKRSVRSDVLTHRIGCTINVQYKGIVIEHVESTHVSCNDLIGW